jgi:hypothetical protein
MYQVNLTKKLRKINLGELSTIAVIDTGTNNHPDLKKNLKLELARVFNSEGKEIGSEKIFNSNTDHGAKVTSVICGASGGKKLGAAIDSKYVPLRIIGHYLSKNSSVEKAMLAALNYCASLNIDCINISVAIGRKKFFTSLLRSLEELYAKNIPIICAAGNDGAKSVNLLALNNKTISVGCTTQELNIAEYSGRGAGIDFLIPVDKFITISGIDSYKISMGTSYASALMTGIISIIITEFKLKNINYSVDTIRTLLINSCVKPQKLSGMSSCGVICENKLCSNIRNIGSCA